MQMTTMASEGGFDEIRYLTRETIRSILEQDYVVSLYALSLLECICY